MARGRHPRQDHELAPSRHGPGSPGPRIRPVAVQPLRRDGEAFGQSPNVRWEGRPAEDEGAVGMVTKYVDMNQVQKTSALVDLMNSSRDVLNANPVSALMEASMSAIIRDEGLRSQRRTGWGDAFLADTDTVSRARWRAMTWRPYAPIRRLTAPQDIGGGAEFAIAGRIGSFDGTSRQRFAVVYAEGQQGLEPAQHTSPRDCCWFSGVRCREAVV